MRQLESVLQMLEESMTLCAELCSTKEEVRQLRAELNKVNCRLVELWQENCKQLIDNDLAMTEGEEMQLLREQLQMREMELAGLKLSHLRESAICSHAFIPEISSQAVIPDDHSGELPTQAIKSSITQPTARPTRGSLFPSLRISRDDIPTSCGKKGPRKYLLLGLMFVTQLQRLSREVMLEHLQQQLTSHKQNMLLHHR